MLGDPWNISHQFTEVYGLKDASQRPTASMENLFRLVNGRRYKSIGLTRLFFVH